MKNLLTFVFCFLISLSSYSQIGSIKTEDYKANFEKTKSIDSVANYTDTLKYPIQILKIGITSDVYEMYPELKDKRVGLGVTNIVIEYLEYTNRFEFTEDKLEIKERMIAQFKASDKGFTENKIDGRGKIKLAKYFVYIEIYDFSVSEDEVVKMNGKATATQTTRIGLQIRFVDAETGTVMVGSGLGEAKTVKMSTILDDVDEIKFNQSTIGISTKKALETASARIIEKMIKQGLFKN
jgi:hypothetical protein